MHSIIGVLSFTVHSNCLEHLGDMQIEVPQAQSFSFVKLEAGPGDFHSPMSLWVIFSEALV